MKRISRVFSIAWGRTTWRSAAALLALVLLTSTALAAQNVTGGAVGTGRGVNNVAFVQPYTGQVVRDFAGEILVQLDRNVPGDRLGPTVRTFCVELNVEVAPSRTNPPPYQDGGPIADCHVRYLLGQYFAIAAPTNDQAAATQLAIWHYTDGLNLTTIQNATLRTAATTLVGQAEAYVAANGCPVVRSTPPTLAISPASASVGPGQTQTYTVQVTPADAATSVTLQISGSATFQGGGQQITIPLTGGSATFVVINGATGSSTISASINFVIDPGTQFVSTRTPPTQKLVLASGTSLTQSAQATLQQGTTSTPTDTPTSTATTTGTATSTATSTATTTGTPATSTATTTGTPATRTITPTPGECCDEPTETPTSGGGGGGGKTATSTATTGTSTETPVGGTVESTSTPAGVVFNDQAAGGAVRPASLPNTGDQGGGATSRYLSLLIALLLVGAGALLRRRSPDGEKDR